MRAGRLREQITIQSPVLDATDNYGQGIKDKPENWVDFATVWGGVETLTGREYIMGSKQDATVSHKVRLRYIEGVKPQMSVLWGTRRLNIVSALEDRRHSRELILMCRERQDG